MTEIPNPFTLSDLQTGKPDPRGRAVRDILWSMKDFKIFKTDIGISPIFSDDAATATSQKEAYFAMGDGIAEFNHLIHAMRPVWPFRKYLESQPDSQASRTRTHYERELARCIAQALSGKVEEAKAALDRLHTRLAARVSNRGRITHLVVNVVLVMIALIVGVLIVRFGVKSELKFSVNEMVIAIMMGCIGALFSTSVRLRSMVVDPTVSIWMHIIYGGQRVLVGALGALILYFGFRSGIVTGLFQPLADTTAQIVSAPTDAADGAADGQPAFDVYWLAFVSILAGFSEQLVPNLLESKSDGAGDATSETDTPEPAATVVPATAVTDAEEVATPPVVAETVETGSGTPVQFDSKRSTNGG